MDEPTPSQWIARCAERLGEHWRTVPASELEEVAVDIWRDAELRRLPPDDAAARWLSPITGPAR